MLESDIERLPDRSHGVGKAGEPAVWFPAVRCGTGADVFTETLAGQLQKHGIRTEITWLPHRAEYAPWTVAVPEPPDWANIVHVNTWLHPRFIPWNLAVVATLHHSIHHPALEPYKGWPRSTYHRYWIRRVERATMHRADCVVAVSQFAADTARRVVLDRPMDVIHNGIDLQRFRPPQRRSPHQPFRLLYVGGWKMLKGVDLMAPVMRQLGDPFELRYTSGPAAERDKLHMPANMHDIGRLKGEKTVVDAMQNADALLFPSRSEGFGLVAAEAMACGLPVIATRGSSLTEVVQDGSSGILCPQDDVGAFSTAARRLAGDQALWQMMSNAAVERVARKFSLASMIDAYVDVYVKRLRRSAGTL